MIYIFEFIKENSAYKRQRGLTTNPHLQGQFNLIDCWNIASYQSSRDEPVDQIINVERFLKLFEVGALHNVGSSAIILIILWISRVFILKIVHHQTKSPNARYSWRKISLYAFVFLAVVLIGRLWLNGLQPILAFMGIIAAALTITLKEVILNMAGIIVILWRSVFIVGDRIEISQHKGDVVGIGLFYFTLMEVGNWVSAEQSTGRIIKVPNSLVLTQPITNYTKTFPFIWDEISITVTFDSNWKKARAVLLEIALQKTQNYEKEVKAIETQSADDELIRYHHFTPKIYIKPVSQSPAGVSLTLRYLCKPRERRDMENRLWEAIFDQFAEVSDITISHA